MSEGSGSGRDFDRNYWDRHWDDRGDQGSGSMASDPASPYLARELGGLAAGAALDAGCGAGAEAVWLAEHGWQVTAADISAEALRAASVRVAAAGAEEAVRLVEVDLEQWEPESPFDLVTTHYAHPTMPQLYFYARIARWVAPGGTLLVVGHRADHDDAAPHGHGHGHGHGGTAGEPHAAATTTAAAVTALLGDGTWDVVTADEPDRTLAGAGGPDRTLRDVVVRATRRVGY